jgi:hypothetical protein
MTSTEDSPSGRSQDLTCAEAEEKIVVSASEAGVNNG